MDLHTQDEWQAVQKRIERHLRREEPPSTQTYGKLDSGPPPAALLSRWLYRIKSFFSRPPKTTLARGRWADSRYPGEVDEITETRPSDTKAPYVGYLVDSTKNTVRLRYKGEKHLLCFGGPGVGKSTSLCTRNLLMLERSMIVMDPKGQLAAITARKRKDMGKVIILNPFMLHRDEYPHLKSTGWNPLLQLNPKGDFDFESDARVIAEAMRDNATGTNGEFFEASAENLWTAFAMWERMTNGTAASMRNVLSQFSRPASELTATLEKMRDSDNYALQVLGGYAHARLTDKSSQSTSLQDVLATIIKGATFLFDGRIENDMRYRVKDGVERGGPINFRAMHDEITTVYVILPMNQLRKQAKWLRLFVNVALNELSKAPPSGKLPPVLFMLDEFGNLGRLSEIVNAMNMARDFRVQLWMFLQNFESLTRHYPDEWTSFFSGAGVITSYALHDPKSASEISEMLGKKEVWVRSASESQQSTEGAMNEHFMSTETKSKTGSTSVSLQVRALLEADELRHLRRGETVSFIDPCPYWARAYTPSYRHFPDYETLDPNPFYHG